MQSEKNPESFPKTPKKRAPVKRTKEQLWSAAPSSLSHIAPDLASMQRAVSQLQERLHLLEQGWEELLERLSEQEDSMDSTQEEDEMN